MNRRRFLSAVATAVGAFTLDPERLLWVPGQRVHFDIHRGNTLITPDYVVNDIGRIVAEAWEAVIAGGGIPDTVFMPRYLFEQLGGDPRDIVVDDALDPNTVIIQ